MSQTGKLLRGMKWWRFHRDRDGVLKPEISKDANKMFDVNHFLDYTNDENREEISIELMRYLTLAKTPMGKQSVLYKDLKEKFTKPWPEKEVKLKSKSKEK